MIMFVCLSFLSAWIQLKSIMNKYNLEMEVNWKMQTVNLLLVFLIFVVQTTVYWMYDQLGLKILYLIVVECLSKLMLKIVYVYLMASFGINVEVRSVLQTDGELAFIGVDPLSGHEIFNLAFPNNTANSVIDDASQYD
jgi:hypothetical protein